MFGAKIIRANKDRNNASEGGKTAHQAADERLHGVGARGEAQDPQGLSRHAQQ